MNGEDLMTNIRRRVTFYRITAIYVCLMLTLILIALVTGFEVDLR